MLEIGKLCSTKYLLFVRSHYKTGELISRDYKTSWVDRSIDILLMFNVAWMLFVCFAWACMFTAHASILRGCLLTYFLTPWCRVHLETLTGLQLAKEFPTFHRTRRFITALTCVRHLWLRCLYICNAHSPVHYRFCVDVTLLTQYFRQFSLSFRGLYWGLH